jgi:LmbE family N-acetylglucosaminyl deacetylase
MNSFALEFRPRHVLVVGAHSDDIEIGCGGTLLRLLEGTARVTWVVLAAENERRIEAVESANRFLDSGDVRVAAFRERYFPYLPELKEYFDDLGKSEDPDVVMCPWSGDAHQDHQTVAKLVHNTFRDHLILEYEIPKTDGDLGRPHIYVDLPLETMERKVELIVKGFPSQAHHQWFDPEAFKGLMRIRGIEAQSSSGYAEAFHSRRLKLMSL